MSTSNDHILLVALFDDEIIANGAAGLGDVLYAGSKGALDIVAERKECIRTQRHIAAGGQPCSLVTLGQTFGLFSEVILPDAVGADIFLVAVDVAVDDIIAVGTAQVCTERQVQSLGMLAKEPSVCLGTCQTGAMDTALLTGADADSLSVNGVADRVGLSIFQGKLTVFKNNWFSSSQVTFSSQGIIWIC